MNCCRNWLIALLVLSSSGVAHADVFGSGDSAFEIEFVTIGDPGNLADSEQIAGGERGAVPYTYRIGKFESSRQMVGKATTLGNLDIGFFSPLTDKPMANISWFEAATFVNWLNESTGNGPAYKFIEVPIGTRPVSTVTTFALWEPGDLGYDADTMTLS